MDTGKVSYKKRLITVVSALLVVGFLGTSVSSYLVSRASLRKEIVSTGLPLTSDNVYSEVQKDLLQPVFVSSMMASDTFLKDWALGGEGDVAAIAKYLKTIKDKYAAISSFFVSDKTMRYYNADGVFKEVRESEPRDAWYFRVRQMKDPYETNVDPDMANRDTMTVFINYRVTDYEGRFMGAAGVGVTMDSMLTRIQDYRKRYGHDIFFVNREDKVVLGTANLFSKDEDVTTLIEEGKKAADGSFDRIWKNQKVLLNMRFIPELNWYLLVVQREDESTRLIRNTFLFNLLICGLITIVVVTATAYTISLYQEKLERIASFDKLTGMLNRQAFGIVFDQVMRDVERARDPLCVLLMDLDHFKHINDTLGHPVGDRVLEEVAEVIRASLRKGDPCCRWGGEEFLVLLRHCDEEDATRLGDKLRDRVAESTFVPDAPDVRVTLSLGIAQYRPGEGTPVFVARADAALYAAKSKGRNRTECAD